MTVTTTTTTNTYTGDGTTTAFSFTFEILETTDIKVIVVTTATGVESVRSIGTGSTNYAVTGTGNVNGGTVTFVTAPTASETVFLMRNMGFTQPTDYRTNDPFPAETHENALDRMALQIQQVSRRLDRALLRPESDTTSGALPHNIDLKGGVLKFNSSSGVPEADSSLTDVATSSANGLMSSSDKAKLDGIEASATTDQTASEILSAIKTVDGASSGLDADLLDGQQGSYYLDASNFSGLGTVATLNVGIGNNNIPKFTSGVADNDFLKVDGSVIEGRSASEVVSDLGVITADSTTTLTNKTIDASQLSGTVADARLPASISSDITGNAATATLASTTTVSDSTANTNFPVVFHDESNGLLDDTGALRYNPSTGELLVPKLTVAGTTTTVDTVTMNAANAIVFEGATADAHETTLTITDPTADRTITLPDATGTVSLLTNTETLTNKTLTTPVINGFSGTGNGSITGDLTLTSTDAGAGADPILELYRNSASPTDGDVLGEIHFFGNDEGGTKTKYAEIKSIAGSEDNGNERGQLLFNLVQNGTEDVQFISMGFNLIQFFKNPILRPNVNIQFEGSSDDAHETTLTVTDPTADRTITLPDATGTVLLADGDGSSLTNVNATTLDSLDSTSFLRSDAADTKTSGHLDFSDNVRLRFGDGNDLQIFHNGSNSSIQDAGTGGLIIQAEASTKITNVGASETYAVFNQDGAVDLYFDNNKKFNTTSTGATVTGVLTADGVDLGDDEKIRLGDSQDLEIYHDGSNSFIKDTGTGDLVIEATHLRFRADNGETYFLGTANGSVELYHDNNKKLETTSTGVQITSFDPSANEEPQLDLFRNSASPAVNDVIGHITFSGENDASEKITYAEIETIITDETDGTEDSSVKFNAIRGGSSTTYYQIGFGVNQFHQDVLIESSDAGATENPTLDLYRNSASPADNDVLGHIHFSGENDADQKVVYNEIESRLVDASDGTEDGRLVINSILNGTTTTYYSTGFGFNQFHQDVLLAQNIELKFEGATNDAVRTTLTVADPSSNRTITLPDATGTTVLTSLADADASRGIIAVAAGRFDSDGSTVKASNLSCSRTATGNYTLTFGSARPDANYIVTGQIIESTSTKDDVKIHIEDGSQTTTAFNVNIYEGDNGTGADADVDRKFYIVVHDF